MNKDLNLQLSVELCHADMVCGFISVTPVLGDRDELICRRLDHYQKIISAFHNKLMCDATLNEKSAAIALKHAISMICADIQSDAISLAPVLYDRDELINSKLRDYFHYLYPRAVEVVKTAMEEANDLLEINQNHLEIELDQKTTNLYPLKKKRQQHRRGRK